MLTRTNRLESTRREAAASAVAAAAADFLGCVQPTPVLLRSGERRWFGNSERVFNPQASRATLLRPRSN